MNRQQLQCVRRWTTNANLQAFEHNIRLNNTIKPNKLRDTHDMHKHKCKPENKVREKEIVVSRISDTNRVDIQVVIAYFPTLVKAGG